MEWGDLLGANIQIKSEPTILRASFIPYLRRMKLFASILALIFLALPLLALEPSDTLFEGGERPTSPADTLRSFSTLYSPLSTLEAPRPAGKWWLSADLLSFFKDNEWDGTIAKGYTLPGLRLRPTLHYQVHPQVEVSAGAEVLIYHGAHAFPNYAFHDIAHWKGHQYQAGAHIVPIVRTKVDLGSAQLVLGSIYGGLHHDLVEPLYHRELQLSADPELGAQFRIARQRWAMDLWIDWQSFIFEFDNHQEAFTMGMTQRFDLVRRPDEGFTLSLPLAMVAQHRGGEQDRAELNLGVQTLVNASVGLRARWQRPAGWLRAWQLEGHLLAAYQKDGQLWPFDGGLGGWLAASAQLGRHWHVGLGTFRTERFVSLYGSPFFGTWGSGRFGLSALFRSMAVRFSARCRASMRVRASMA